MTAVGNPPRGTVNGLRPIIGYVPAARPLSPLPPLSQSCVATDQYSLNPRSLLTPGSQGKFSAVWKLYRDAVHPPLLVRSVEELRRKSGIETDWRSAPHLQGLLILLARQGLATPENLSSIMKIEQVHGRAAMEQISWYLNQYMAAFPLPGREQKSILQDALHDAAYPSAIRQLNKNSCTAAAVQIKLAIERPVQYVATLTALARNTAYQLPSGQLLQPNNTWRGDLKDARSYSSKIMENAFMALGKASGHWSNTYNSAQDPDGLDYSEKTKLIQKVFGSTDYEDVGIPYGQYLYQLVEDDIARGRPVTTSFEGHCVLVVGIDKMTAQHQVIIDSWGKQYTMPVNDFIRLVKDVSTVNDPGNNNFQTPAGTRVILGDRD